MPMPLSLSLLLLLAAVQAPSPSPSPMTVEDVLALQSVTDVRMSPDGSTVAYVLSRADFDENRNDTDLWIVGTNGGEPVRMTFHPGTDDAPQWAPDGRLLFFSSDRAEGGGRQVFAIRPGGGEAFQVTDWAEGVESFEISPDGNKIAFVAKPEKTEDQEAFEEERGRPEVWDEYYDDEWSRLWVAPLERGVAGEATLWSSDAQYVTRMVWSPDSTELAYAARPEPALRTNREADVYVSGGDRARARRVTELPGGERPVTWTKERGILVSGSGQLLGTYNQRLWSVEPPVSLTDALDEHAGYVSVSISSTGEALLLEASFGTGRGLVRLEGENLTRLSDPSRFYSRFSASRDGTKLAFVGESGADSPDVYFADLTAGSAWAPKRLTDVNPQVRDFDLGEQRVVSWTSRADGEPIEGVLTLPVGHREGEAVPLLLVIHGGPSGVSAARFSARRGAYPIQVFAGMGYAVLEPNYRGSTGYGERFRGLNRGGISGRDWIDIDSGVDAMIERGLADPERLGVMGWSFGGHHTYWGITQTDRFKAASAGAGANDLVSMYSQTDLPEFYHTYLGPKPWEDFELYEERSAYRGVARVTTPLLIQVGENDERVPAEQSIQFYEAVKAIGKVETKLVIYPGQPHGVREPRLVRDLLMRNVEWFSRWIPAGPAGGATSMPEAAPER